jgi:hypothetical protein
MRTEASLGFLGFRNLRMWHTALYTYCLSLIFLVSEAMKSPQKVPFIELILCVCVCVCVVTGGMGRGGGRGHTEIFASKILWMKRFPCPILWHEHASKCKINIYVMQYLNVSLKKCAILFCVGRKTVVTANLYVLFQL